MKRLVCLLFTVFLLFVFSSCSSPEKKETPEDNISLDETGEIVGEPIDYFDTVNITMEKLEVETYFGKKYVFNGVKIQQDNGVNLIAALVLLQAQKDNDNLCPLGHPKIELKFTDTIPQSVTWYNHYYLEKNSGSLLYPSIRQTNTIDNVDASVTLPIGMDLAIVLDSQYPSKEHYRLIRIVCDFDDQLVEYYICMDN